MYLRASSASSTVQWLSTALCSKEAASARATPSSYLKIKQFSASTLSDARALKSVCRRCTICDFLKSARWWTIAVMAFGAPARLAPTSIIQRSSPVKQTSNRRGLLQWLNLRGIGGLKTGKDQDDKPRGDCLCPIYAP